MKGIFVTGTDTGVGKTIVTGLLADLLSNQGYNCITQKWVETGSKSFSKDIKSHFKLMKKNEKCFLPHLSFIAPYVFKFSSSPHLAAGLENKIIRIDKIEKSYKYLAGKFEFVIVEGAGGVLVPINKKTFLIDIVKKLRLGVVVVAGNKLGAINHTLLTIEALKLRKIKILGIVFNNFLKGEDDLILKDNIKIIKELSKENVLGVLPFTKDIEVLYNRFKPIGKKILKFYLYKNE